MLDAVRNDLLLCGSCSPAGRSWYREACREAVGLGQFSGALVFQLVESAFNKLEYEGTGELAQTDTCCKLLDPKTARCKDYKNRKKIVPDCIQLTPKVVAKMDWLPKTCGYRLVHLSQDLYWWHPLVSGDPETVHQAGISARGRVIPEDQVEDISERVVDWFA